MLEKLARGKYASLLGLFESYEENELFWLQHLGLYSQHFIFFVTYECTQ
jgi:hypothetical protein